MPILPLSRAYPSRDGTPVLSSVDTAIFTRTFFGACLACGFCHDACCDHGVDVEVTTVARILREAAALEPLVGTPSELWFTHELERDRDFPGGAYRRTAVVDGACVFRNRRGRGCLLHAHCLSTRRDYHELKPLVSSLFPLTFGDGLLSLSNELSTEDSPFVCAVEGPSVYRAQRSELAWYFGEDLVRELDAIAEGKTFALGRGR